jgi:predicted transcriptional regulator
MSAEKLTEIIRNTSWLNLSELERVCGLPNSTLQKVKQGKQALPKKHEKVLVQELKKVNFA